MSSVVKEEITLINNITNGSIVAAELQIKLVAVKDGFYIRDRKKGEKELFYDTGFYNLEGDKIVHARVYRRFTDKNTMDLAKMYCSK